MASDRRIRLNPPLDTRPGARSILAVINHNQKTDRHWRFETEFKRSVRSGDGGLVFSGGGGGACSEELLGLSAGGVVELLVGAELVDAAARRASASVAA